MRREALMRSADLYDKAHNAPKMVASLEKFVTDYPTPAALLLKIASISVGEKAESPRISENRLMCRSMATTELARWRAALAAISASYLRWVSVVPLS